MRLPSRKSDIRLGVSYEKKQASAVWKFWIRGDEIYATCRTIGHLTKISWHQSGQMHMHQGSAGKQILAPPVELADGAWLHGLELRFLVSADSLRPQPDDFGKHCGFLLDIPEGRFCLLNLLISSQPNAHLPLPPELLGAALIWVSHLRSGHNVILVARLPLLDEENMGAIKYIREELRPRLSSSSPSNSPPYVEIRQVHWSPAGSNVVAIVPMGIEALPVSEPVRSNNSSKLTPLGGAA